MASLNYTQISPILNDLYNMYTGRTSNIQLTFGAMQNTFKMGLEQQDDNLYQLIPTVLAKNTIFSIRPYSRKLAGMVWDSQRYGNYIRKFTPIINDSNIENQEWNVNVELAKPDAEQDWKAGSKPVKYDVLLTISSGGQTFARQYTIWKNQLNAAFDSEEGVSAYFSMLMTEFSNVYEIDLENVSRGQIANLALILNDAGETPTTEGNPCKPTQVFHALTRYNNETGLNLNQQSILIPENFRPFMLWFSAELKTLKENLSIHSTLYHGDFTGKEVNRHTDESNLRFYLASKFANYFSANGADLFNPEKAPIGDFESVTFWTDPQNPYRIAGSAIGVQKDGTTALNIDTAIVDNVLGIMMDIDCMGVVPIDQWSATEPFNARYGFRNGFNHYTFKTPLDLTENAVLIKLD